MTTREIAQWEPATTVGDLAVQTDQYPQKLVISDGAHWNEIVTSNSSLHPHQVREAIQTLLSNGETRADLEPMIRDIINDVIQERKDEQPMFEL